MKKYPIITAVLCFFLLGNQQVKASDFTYQLYDTKNMVTVPARLQQVMLVMNCYSGLNFTGQGHERRISLNYNEPYKEITYNDDRACLSYRIMGIAFHINPEEIQGNLDWNSDQFFAVNFSLSFQADTQTLNAAHTENYGTNTEVVQTTSLNEPPTVITNTNAFASRTTDASAWMRNGFATQYFPWPMSATIEEVAYNPADHHPTGGGYDLILETHTYNITVIGRMVNNRGVSPFTNGELSVYIGDHGYTGAFLLDVHSAWYWRLVMSKGNTVFTPSYNLSDHEAHEIMTEILETIQQNSNQGVIDAINNQTVTQIDIAATAEAQAQQRQEQLMNDDTTTGESQIANFMTDFDDGSDPTLSGIITKPLELIQALTSTACVPLVVQLPYTSDYLTLPCGRALINQYFPQAIILWDIFSLGLIAYWIGTKLFVMIHEFKNPDKDGNIEPLEL